MKEEETGERKEKQKIKTIHPYITHVSTYIPAIISVYQRVCALCERTYVCLRTANAAVESSLLRDSVCTFGPACAESF